MDQIDLNLIEAWERVGARCAREPGEAMRRMRRKFCKTVFRPVRPWCLCLRAADTRITKRWGEIEPWGADERQMAHEVTLDGKAIRELTKPVMIHWPGVPMWEAAKKFGISREMMWAWRKRGFVRLRGFDYPGLHNMWGKLIPVVYTPSPLDPNHPAGRPPDYVWGSLWQGLWERMPENFEMTARRVPRYRVWKGESYFRGWDWECAGRWVEGPSDEATERRSDGGKWSGWVHRACGRRCKYLFGPLPVWTLAKSSARQWALEMPAESGLAGVWEPGLGEIEVGKGNRGFACKECWNIHNITLSNYRGWNDFVTHISGGLLYGHEVERPVKEAPIVRKRREWKRKKMATQAQGSGAHDEKAG
ncbi:MAG: hypothetical protein L0Y44_01470 [Phycisphaerales bacterium]|nr:hypothetical protein [Phycisphaerales bacterium]MCI0675773.1 hypothetical protein [Phycisphaerales bacterium]